MHVIEVDNVNQALHDGLFYLLAHGVEEPSRNGPVLVAPGPVTTVYRNPLHRVLFSSLRDANPFFHVFESLWMLAGRNDLAYLQQFNSRFGAYSDDGKTIRGAYGHRWRSWFGYDQLAVIIKELREKPDTRRAVLTMWDAGEYAYDLPENRIAWGKGNPGDLLANTVDKPCNTHIYFDVRGGKLNMTVCCRSNDALWGAYGANAVDMSFLQEYVAAHVDVPVGVYRQMSNNFHIYLDVLPRDKAALMAESAATSDLYQVLDMVPPRVPLVTDGDIFERELNEWSRGRTGGGAPFKNEFLQHVFHPMLRAWQARKAKEPYNVTMGHLAGIKDAAWRINCTQWMQRRYMKEAQ